MRECDAHRRIVRLEAIPLGFNRFAFAYRSRNREANSFSVVFWGTSSLTIGFGFP
jgi:hypothetical protein